MNDLAREDLDRMCSYVFQNEQEDFAECLMENPEAFPGLSAAELEKLGALDWGSEEFVLLLELAAGCEANHHPYACAFRLWREFCKNDAVHPAQDYANRIDGPCPDCGRVEFDGHTEAIPGTDHWFSPCPSDDCPSHDDNSLMPSAAEDSDFKPVIIRSMCCSTKHISKKDSCLLDRDDCPVSVDEYEYGAYVNTGWYPGTPEPDSLPAERERELSKFGFSAEFIWLTALAYAADCKYLVLDCDGTVYAQLPKFNW